MLSPLTRPRGSFLAAALLTFGFSPEAVATPCQSYADPLLDDLPSHDDVYGLAACVTHELLRVIGDYTELAHGQVPADQASPGARLAALLLERRSVEREFRRVTNAIAILKGGRSRQEGARQRGEILDLPVETQQRLDGLEAERSHLLQERKRIREAIEAQVNPEPNGEGESDAAKVMGDLQALLDHHRDLAVALRSHPDHVPAELLVQVRAGHAIVAALLGDLETDVAMRTCLSTWPAGCGDAFGAAAELPELQVAHAEAGWKQGLPVQLAIYVEGGRWFLDGTEILGLGRTPLLVTPGEHRLEYHPDEDQPIHVTMIELAPYTPERVRFDGQRIVVTEDWGRPAKLRPPPPPPSVWRRVPREDPPPLDLELGFAPGMGVVTNGRPLQDGIAAETSLRLSGAWWVGSHVAPRFDLLLARRGRQIQPLEGGVESDSASQDVWQVGPGLALTTDSGSSVQWLGWGSARLEVPLNTYVLEIGAAAQLTAGEHDLGPFIAARYHGTGAATLETGIALSRRF